MKILTIVGARPQFIKAAPVSRIVRREHREILVHTGQHYDDKMSAIFFRELELPEPDYNLGIGSGAHGWQTGQMLAEIEKVLLAENPDWVLVYGDTNSTLAGALAAVKLHIPIAHVEAGLRSFNRSMPEEHNRVLTDHCADLLLCPTKSAVEWLAQEGLTEGVHLVDDVMYDAVLHNKGLAMQCSDILTRLEISPGEYLLATVHRPYNTDIPERLRSILMAFAQIDETVIFLAHPRTQKRIQEFGLSRLVGERAPKVKFLDPVGYLEMLALEDNARLILTDSGGVQKEAYFLAVPCLTLRPETEWVETVEAGWNLIVDARQDKIVYGTKGHWWPHQRPEPVFGDGNAAERISQLFSVPRRGKLC